MREFLFAFSGILVLLASIVSPVLLPYPLFVLAYLRGWRLPRFGSPPVRLLLSTLICTAILEIGAWLDNFIQNAPEPALLHPQLIPDLIMSVGVYSAWGLAWWLMLRRYHFTTQQVFTVTGLYGVLIEQQGSVFLAGLGSLPWGVLLWLFVAVAYGSTMGLAFFLARDGFAAARDTWVKYPLAWAALLVLTLLTSILWGVVLRLLDVLPPEKLPMRDYPLW